MLWRILTLSSSCQFSLALSYTAPWGVGLHMAQVGTSKNGSEWRMLYTAAILETDNAKLMARVELAQTAITARLGELNGRDSSEELEELSDATHGLSILRQERQDPA